MATCWLSDSSSGLFRGGDLCCMRESEAGREGGTDGLSVCVRDGLSVYGGQAVAAAAVAEHMCVSLLVGGRRRQAFTECSNCLLLTVCPPCR